MNKKPREKIICSACLLGINCRYNGRTKISERVVELSEESELIPVCPEQLGGLPTPRPPVEIRDGCAFDETGREVSEYFQKGAKEVLKIAKANGATKAILKQRSPSCGSGQLKMLSGQIIKGDGITAALLKANGVEVLSEEDL